MSGLFDVTQRVLDKTGTTFIEPRREDGHGSSSSTPTYTDSVTTIKDGPQVDAFNRLRISNAITIFRDNWPYSATSVFWEHSVSGTGAITHLGSEPQVQLSTGGTASGASAIRQTTTYFHYYPGNSQLLFMAFNFNSNGIANVIRRMGYFDANNGVFLEQNGTVNNFVVRSDVSGSVVNTTVAQSSWNLDKMDGTGSSGITLDFTKQQILVIDFQWLGAGRVRFGFDVAGGIIWAHQALHSNVLTTTYSGRGSLPLRAEISNSGTAASTQTIKYSSVSLLTEGIESQLQNIPFTASNGITSKTVTTRAPILSIQCRQTFNSRQVRGHLHPDIATAIVGSGTAFVELVYNGTLTGASWSDVDTNNSIAQFDTSATAISGGIVLQSGFVSGGSTNSRGTGDTSLAGLVTISNNIAGTTSGVLTIVATSFTGAAIVNASLGWTEHQ